MNVELKAEEIATIIETFKESVVGLHTARLKKYLLIDYIETIYKEDSDVK